MSKYRLVETEAGLYRIQYLKRTPGEVDLIGGIGIPPTETWVFLEGACYGGDDFKLLENAKEILQYLQAEEWYTENNKVIKRVIE